MVGERPAGASSSAGGALPQAQQDSLRVYGQGSPAGARSWAFIPTTATTE